MKQTGQHMQNASERGFQLWDLLLPAARLSTCGDTDSGPAALQHCRTASMRETTWPARAQQFEANEHITCCDRDVERRGGTSRTMPCLSTFTSADVLMEGASRASSCADNSVARGCPTSRLAVPCNAQFSPSFSGHTTLDKPVVPRRSAAFRRTHGYYIP